MKQQIAIIGAGLFGVTAYLTVKKKGFDCVLFEKNNSLLSGASTNNLNRVHMGYHYPRDKETVKQSKIGKKSFCSFYSKSIIKNFKNYYFIAKKSKINLKDYLNFCKKNKLKYKKINLENFFLKNRNFEGAIEVNEPIYDWKLIKSEINDKLKKIKKKYIKLNERVIFIKKKLEKYEVKTNKDIYNFDIIIDCSYEGSNKISSKISKPKKIIYQKTVIFEFLTNQFHKVGLAVMDGNFFSFLPKGNANNFILYDVVNSVLKQKKSFFFPNEFKKKNIDSIINSKIKTINKVKYYFPEIKIKISNYFISSRIFSTDFRKTDKRVSKILTINKNYYRVVTAKVDHCVDIAEKLVKKINNQ